MRGPRAALTAVFFLNGAGFASLFSRVPALQRDLGLSDAGLGLALLAGGLALLVAQPLAGALSTRVGTRPVILASAAGYGAALPLCALAPSPAAFVLALSALGAANGSLDVAMNAQASTVAARATRPIFSSFHAAFSFGALAGAGLGGLVAEAGVDPRPHFAVAGAVVALGILATRPGLLRAGEDAAGGGPAFARPTRDLAILGAIAFCAALAEGAVGDWSAIHLSRTLDAGPGLAAAGLAAFSLAMGIGRLAADPIGVRVGAVALARGGALLAGAGIAVAAAAPGAAVAVAGFAVMGAGLSALFPLTLLAASRAPGHAPAVAIAGVSATGYAGFLAGPAVIGFASELASLPVALALVAVLCAVAAALARAVAPAAA